MVDNCFFVQTDETCVGIIFISDKRLSKQILFVQGGISCISQFVLSLPINEEAGGT